MKSLPHLRRLAGFALIGLGVAVAARGQTTNVVNDGSSAANLTRLMNQFGTAGATWSLVPEAGALRAEQSAAYPDFPVNAVWYAPGVRPVSAAYAVLADVRPAAANPENVPGVMGWLDPQQGRGIVFRVVPGVFGAFQVAVIDFTAPTAEGNDSTTGLFQPDGAAALPGLGSAWSGLGDYDPDQFVTLELAFAPPTAADRAAVSNVTARVTARAYQTDGVQPLSEPIELLTTLPVPMQARVGYAAKLDTLFLPGGVVGYLKNLRVVGDIELVNQPPTVALTNPADGTRFTVAPASVALEATAGDPDGTVVRVEFLQDGVVVGTVNAPPYRFLVTGLADGQYAFAARAVDNQGATTTSAAVRVTVEDVPPTITLIRPTEGAVYAAPAQLELEAEVSNPGGQSLERVEFLQNGNVVGQALAAPYRVTLGGLGPGNYAFQARLIFGGGRMVGSAVVAVTVTGVSQPPVLTEAAALPSGGPFEEFQFTARNLAGGTYQLEATTNFTSWTVVASGAITGPNQVFRVPRSTTSNRQFFRLLVSGGGGGGVTPARLSGPQARPSAAQFTEFQFTAAELTGSRYQVEASSNLRDWTVVESGTVSGTSRVFTFPRSTGSNVQFYRVVSLP